MCPNNRISTSLHFAMYPWYAMGHINNFLQLANKLAARGHTTSFFVPEKIADKVNSDNHHPTLITFIPVVVPKVDGMPPGAETTNDDVLLEAYPFLMAAMDLTKDTINSHLATLKPDIVLFDFAHWIPEVARVNGAKSVYYLTTFIVGSAYLNTTARGLPMNHNYSEVELAGPPPGFPSPFIRLGPHEARSLAYTCSLPFGEGMTLLERLSVAYEECDAIAIKSCKEIEGASCDYLEGVIRKPILLAGPVAPDFEDSTLLDDHVERWLSNNGFCQGSVIYCSLGSECILSKDQFQELLLGLELTGMPFLAVLKQPTCCNTIEDAMPEGFGEKVKGRGLIYKGWVKQKQILQHPSVGCFVTHCGAGSLTEAIMSQCQIVMMPQAVDQFCNARLMSMELKIGVEVENRAEDGFFNRLAIQNAISTVMEGKSDVGREVRNNHSKLRGIISCKRLDEFYVSSFVIKLQELMLE